jgi:UDPglucose--hexose-1-phosphate uridylyltransferase
MSELRRNPLTGEWVIIAPERGLRPHDAEEEDKEDTDKPLRPALDPDCPFCPGSEGELPEISAQYPAPQTGVVATPRAPQLGPAGDRANAWGGERAMGLESGSPLPRTTWQVRVVPNKFPALRSRDGGADAEGTARNTTRSAADGIDSMKWSAESGPMETRRFGAGCHEVIIETPRHDLDMATLGEEGAAAVLHIYQERLKAARALPEVRQVVVFRNHGLRAGTSLLHPHSQLVALPIVSEEAARRERESRAYFAETHRCLLCELVQREQAAGRRIVHSGEDFAVMVPFAAEVPFEMWLVPRRHRPDFAAVPAEELRGLATCLTRVLSLLAEELGDPDYNYILHTCAAAAGNPALHWLLQIRPRLVTPAGFEIGSGMSINPSLPEENAARLRGEGGAAGFSQPGFPQRRT